MLLVRNGIVNTILSYKLLMINLRLDLKSCLNLHSFNQCDIIKYKEDTVFLTVPQWRH